MVTTAQQIEELKRRLYSGVSAIRDGDQSTQHMSRADMEKLLSRLEAQEAGTTRTRIRYPYQVRRGL